MVSGPQTSNPTHMGKQQNQQPVTNHAGGISAAPSDSPVRAESSANVPSEREIKLKEKFDGLVKDVINELKGTTVFKHHQKEVYQLIGGEDKLVEVARTCILHTDRETKEVVSFLRREADKAEVKSKRVALDYKGSLLESMESVGLKLNSFKDAQYLPTQMVHVRELPEDSAMPLILPCFGKPKKNNHPERIDLKEADVYITVCFSDPPTEEQLNKTIQKYLARGAARVHVYCGVYDDIEIPAEKLESTRERLLRSWVATQHLPVAAGDADKKPDERRVRILTHSELAKTEAFKAADAIVTDLLLCDTQIPLKYTASAVAYLKSTLNKRVNERRLRDLRTSSLPSSRSPSSSPPLPLPAKTPESSAENAVARVAASAAKRDDVTTATVKAPQPTGGTALATEMLNQFIGKMDEDAARDPGQAPIRAVVYGAFFRGFVESRPAGDQRAVSASNGYPGTLFQAGIANGVNGGVCAASASPPPPPSLVVLPTATVTVNAPRSPRAS